MNIQCLGYTKWVICLVLEYSSDALVLGGEKEVEEDWIVDSENEIVMGRSSEHVQLVVKDKALDLK